MNTKTYFLFSIILVVGIALGIGLSSMTGDAEKSATAVSGIESGAHSIPLDMDDWCVEHRVPESQCTRCHPELVTAFKERNDWCVEHFLPESHCRICNPNLHFPQEPEPTVAEAAPIVTSVFLHPNKGDCATNHAVIQFASVETSARAGLTIETSITGTGASIIEAPAETRFDETKLATLSSSIDASVIRWLVEPGAPVSAGQAIAEMQSSEMAELEGNHLQAKAEAAFAENKRTRADSLLSRGLISKEEHESIAADADVDRSHLQSSRGLLRAAGMSDGDIAELGEKGEVSPRWLLRSTVDGALLERRAPLGEQLDDGTTLALTGDPGALWIEAHIPERELIDVQAGQPVTFSLDGSIDKVAGTVVWVAQYLDDATRTGLVRAQISQSPRNLRANQFGRLSIEINPTFAPVLVPKDAVQWEGCCNVVFVQEAPDRYRPRKVTLMRGDNRYYQVLSGVKVGEPVVVNGSYLLKTELRKSSLGAGCCEVDSK